MSSEYLVVSRIARTAEGRSQKMCLGNVTIWKLRILMSVVASSSVLGQPNGNVICLEFEILPAYRAIDKTTGIHGHRTVKAPHPV